MKNVRKLFVDRANEAWNALEKETAQPVAHHMMKK